MCVCKQQPPRSRAVSDWCRGQEETGLRGRQRERASEVRLPFRLAARGKLSLFFSRGGASYPVCACACVCAGVPHPPTHTMAHWAPGALMGGRYEVTRVLDGACGC